MQSTYAVQKTPKGWVLTVETVEGTWIHKPTQLGVHKTRRAALTVARLLAGHTGSVVVF
jgi:hypothetical protein